MPTQGASIPPRDRSFVLPRSAVAETSDQDLGENAELAGDFDVLNGRLAWLVVVSVSLAPSSPLVMLVQTLLPSRATTPSGKESWVSFFALHMRFT